MTRKIRYCTDCSKYTMSPKCPSCGNDTILPGPMKFSPEDRYGEYRRRALRNQREKKM